MKCYVAGSRLNFWCPGCNSMKQVCPNRWHWNNDVEKPTLSPSILQTVGPFPDGHKEICHSFVRNGQIEFLGDCTHALAGKTVDLPDLETVIKDLVIDENGSRWSRKS